ncbi:MAG: peptidoglycan editing factor PgeF [Candidatus Goldbacteria bacterium]|nr:peptidoglycan editing factor PgeF [Candidatus Goldiibacteriota bacterium]
MNKYIINLTPTFFKKKLDSSISLNDFIIAITTRKVKNKKQAERILKFKRINILKQIHSDKIIIVKKRKSLHNIKADGIITNLKNFPVAVKVADCIGSVIIEPDKKVLAVVHSGWRGVVKKIILKAIKIMKKKFSCDTNKMVIVTSPSIGPCCYEIGRDLYNKLSKQKLFSNIFSKRNGKIYMDLQKTNKNLLIAAGIKRKNIYINELCTKCNNDLFFSYRAEGKKTGRMYVVGCIK